MVNKIIKRVAQIDKKMGHFPDTISSEFIWRMRTYRVTLLEDKRMIALMDMLDNMGYPYHAVELLGPNLYFRTVFADLYVPDLQIVIRLSSEKDRHRNQIDKEFFIKHKEKFYPLYVRVDETVDFVCEKLEHLIDSIRDARCDGEAVKKGIPGLSPTFFKPEWMKTKQKQKTSKNGKETAKRTTSEKPAAVQPARAGETRSDATGHGTVEPTKRKRPRIGQKVFSTADQGQKVASGRDRTGVHGVRE